VPAQLPQKLPLDQMQTRWASQLNPILANILVNGLLLQNISIISGINVINHLLGRKQQGWIVTDRTGTALLDRTADFNDLTLTLTSTAPCQISLWVF
jgi:hypothetical protein